MNDKKELLNELAKQIQICQLCPLHKGTNNSVPGEGNPNADLLFIGEGPGKKEDELGRPFVGAAGKLLEALLHHIGLSRNDVFIANVVKHRPPQNRDPQPEEVTACWPYLQKQVEIIVPKMIVLLGRHSTHRFLPELVISQAHGKPYRKGNLVYYPMYHPAAALYNGSLREVMFQDAARIPLILKKIQNGK